MTNQNQSGNEKSSTSKRLEEFENLTKSYMESLQLNIKLPSKAEEYLNISQELLQNYSAEMCSEMAFYLSQYGAFLQKEINRHKAIVNWANESINYIIAPYVDQYGGQYTPFAIKKAWAIRENPEAKELLKIKSAADTSVLSLEDLPRRIDTMVQSLKELSMVRRRQ